MANSTPLHVVTGKGGTGKTTVAAALALALAGRGRKVLLCEVEGRQGIAQLFDVPPLPYEERRIATSDEGGHVHALAIDPEAALLEYLQMYYRLGRAGRALDKFGVIDFATTIAPGVRDVLLTGKVYEAARRRRGKSSEFVYDAVVVDAPPTGRIARFLGVNDDVAGLAKVGPIKTQSESIMTMMRSPQTTVHLVTVLEEMPVQETLDGIDELTREGLRVGHVVVNLVRPSLLSDDTIEALEGGRLDAKAVAPVLERAGLPAAAAATLVADGHGHVERQRLQTAQQAIIEDCGRPHVALPLLTGGIDVGALQDLAVELAPLVEDAR
ncbi:ATPase [Aeromicrobium flavum]|uniref:ATPase n=1 Tax=Aeromicrobium flavum TaxID=416568 RepID=A0A512HTZ3_9ACTN|nr:ArsA-related P-loop ATPase [Aeromicrobium flavum]GEO88923.1 ATPase [Aeromicrobium flavum]